MASRTAEPTTSDPDRITFQVQRLVVVQPGRLEVSGRWFGVRGRRFVRPTLTLLANGSPVRLLADLDHKPWATQDGEEWMATFPFEGELEEASELELSVAPDIAVKLADGPVSAASSPPEPAPAQARRAPRVRSEPGRGRPMLSERAQDIERLRDRLAALDQALDREHARRAAAEQELENERTEALNLRSEVGRLRAELDLARAGQSETDAISAELDAARRALGRERAEAQQLRTRLAQAQSALDQPRPPRESAAAAQTRRRAPSASASPAESPAAARSRLRTESAAEGRLRSRSGSADGQPRSQATAVTAPASRGQLWAQAGAVTPPASRAQPVVAQSHRTEPAAPPRPQPALARERPLNPSLRSRPNWLGRILAVLIMLAVIAAIILVIRTTVSP